MPALLITVIQDTDRIAIDHTKPSVNARLRMSRTRPCGNGRYWLKPFKER